MAERRVKVQVPGIVGPTDGTEISIIESVDRWTDIKLDDGTSLRVKVVVISAVRLDGKYDPQGNPQYVLQAQQVMTASSPDHLRQSANKGNKVQ